MVLAEQEAAVEPAGAPAIKPLYLSRRKRNKLAKMQQQQQQQAGDSAPGLSNGNAMAEAMPAASPVPSGSITTSPRTSSADGKAPDAAEPTPNSSAPGQNGHLSDSMPTQQHQQPPASHLHSNGVAASQGAFWQSLFLVVTQ